MSYSDELAKLAELHQRGVLSDEEFARAKGRVLGDGGSPGAQQGGATADAARATSEEPSLNEFKRSRDDRWLGGVCGGIAELTATPTWLWRLMFTLLVVCAGSGVLVYLLLWIFVPEAD
ncbi:PspC domain-containing protein [Roseateles koreensis]|uniref:PspC domain-containing protein n=1 Tax=Roseateles koreensis TaxID=2987526 RepID=A0ABT5KUS3_9BURK|nr:PspC domain-containing protein [Roseateles koreensis]MDC8786556.1 PspC domain-containing protein [Roseateles koreensis]